MPGSERDEATVTADCVGETTVLSEVAVEPQRSSSRVARKRARGDYFASSTNEASAVAPGSAAADAAAAAQEAAAAPIAVSPSEFKVRAQLMFKLDADSPATSGRLPATHRHGPRPTHIARRRGATTPRIRCHRRPRGSSATVRVSRAGQASTTEKSQII